MGIIKNLNKKISKNFKLIFLFIFFIAFLWNISINLYFTYNKCETSTNGNFLVPSVKESLQIVPRVVKKKLKTVKIFCFILTSESKISSKAKIIHDTWAKKCDTYKFIVKIPEYLKSDQILNFGNFEHNENEGIEINNILEPPGIKNDTYRKLTDKVFMTLKYVQKKYSGYDWYLKADDDTFIFVDNLRKFLSEKNSSLPITYGYDFKRVVKDGYHSGGAGYVLSNEALKRIGSKLNENYDFCPIRGFEDMDVGFCLRKLGVSPGESRDESNKERFHPLNVRSHFYGFFPKWMAKYSSHVPEKGLKCCSDYSISFHYMKSADIVKLSELIESHENDQSPCKKDLRFIDIVHHLLS